MKLIESKAEYIPQEEGLEGIYKQIELAGRTAYDSQNKATLDSAKKFVDRMVRNHHNAVLEHGTVYLKFSNMETVEGYHAMRALDKYRVSPYSKIIYNFIEDSNNKFDGFMYIVTNFRVIQENNWLDDLQYLCSPTDFHEKRYTFRFTCSRAIAQELTRHRVFSFMMSSQRYINYSKEMHGGEITYIKPVAYNSWDSYLKNEFDLHLERTENLYMWMLNKGLQPQQARDVLPNATKTELIMTGFASDWRHFLDLRYFEKTGAVHPDMKDLMNKFAYEAQNTHNAQGITIWDDIMSKLSKFNQL